MKKKFVFAILCTVAIVLALLCGIAGLLMLGWNTGIVAMLSVASSITFGQSLTLVIIVWFALFFFNMIRGYVEVMTQQWQMKQVIHNIQHLREELGKMGMKERGTEQPPDLMRHWKDFDN